MRLATVRPNAYRLRSQASLACCVVKLLIAEPKRGACIVLGNACTTPGLRSASNATNTKVTARSTRIRDRPRLVCAGCGVELQSRDVVAAGYLPSLKSLVELEQRAQAALARARDDVALPQLGYDAALHTFYGHGTVCQRCFQAKHYSRLVPATVAPAESAAYASALSTALNRDSLIVHVADLFDWNGSLLAGLRGGIGGDSLQGGTSLPRWGRPHGSSGRKYQLPTPRILLVVNKVDLLPRNVSLARIDVWVRSHARAAGLSGLLAGVHIVSAARGFGVRNVAADIIARKRGRNVYVVGAPNVGKSTLINAVLDEVWNRRKTDLPRGQSVTQPVTINEADLPQGYAAGDTFLGDVAALESSAVASRDVESRHDRRDTDDGMPANARRSTEASTMTSDFRIVLAAEAARKALHRRSKFSEEDRLTISDTTNSGNTEAQRTAPGSNETTTTTTLAVAEPVLSAAPGVPFTTSPMPGTTLGVIGAALDAHGHAYIYDTPGAITNPSKHRLLEALCVSSDDVVGVVAPAERLIAPTYRLTPGRCLWLGGLIRIEYENSNPDASMLFTVVSQLQLHAGRTEDADRLFDRHACIEEGGGRPTLLHPRAGPLSHCYRVPIQSVLAGGHERCDVPWVGPRPALGAREKFTAERMKRRERRALVDVVLEGLGWIVVTPPEVVGMHERDSTTRGATLIVRACEGVFAHIRAPMLPYEQSGDVARQWLT